MLFRSGQVYLQQIINSSLNTERSTPNTPHSTLNTERSTPNTRFLFNPHLDYKLYMVPAIISLLLILTVGFLPALNIVGEKEKGTIEQINVTPIGRFEFIFSKMIPYWCVGIIMLFLAMGAAKGIHGIALPALPSSPYVIRRTGAFALLRPLEIAAQRYVDLHARLDDGGIALSLLPPLRPLGISLTASFDMATGEPSGLRGSYPCAFNELEWSKPYCEAGIGLDHLLGIGRIEYVWRLSYRDIPDSRRSGVAVGIDYVF